jgi:hypothetical protein
LQKRKREPTPWSTSWVMCGSRSKIFPGLEVSILILI